MLSLGCHRRRRATPFLRAGIVGVAAALTLAAGLPAQHPPQAEPAAGKSPDERSATAEQRERRLDEIEKTLRELLQEIRSLRGTPASPAASDEKQQATPPALLPESWLKTITWRSIGPANMGGRIVDLAVYERDPVIYWVATASGGLLKTTNNGVTFEHQFDKQTTVSIGAVAVAPSDPNLVWVGTGENNPRNSVSYGDGVYKSTDGGKTWKNMGLEKTFQIGRIVIHPNDPNIVYVGALGRLYGPNEQRGVFKTTDGGQTWEKVLYVDDNTGTIDLRMNPGDPTMLIAAMWERRRDGFDSWPGSEVPVPDGYNGYDPIQKWGSGGGLFRTTDAGKTWQKLSKGLPSSNFGRVGLDWHRKNPNIVFAIIDCEDIAKGPKPLQVYLGALGEDEDGQTRLVQVIPGSPADKAGVKVGDVLQGAGDTPITGFDQLLDVMRELRAGAKITLKLMRGEEEKQVEVTLENRPGTRPAPVQPAVWLGLAGQTREGKVVVTQLVPQGPAAKSGLQSGDLLEEVAGKPVEDYGALMALVRGRQPGDKLKVKVRRGEEVKEFEVVLESRPGSPRGPAEEESDVYLGVQGQNAEQGARLTRISENGPAEKAKLAAGDIVQAVDDKPIDNYQALVAQIRGRKAGDKMKLTVLRGEEQMELVVTLESRPEPTRPYAFDYGGQSPNVQDQQGARGYEYGGVYKSSDGGETWSRVNSLNSRPMYFSQIRVDPNDAQRVYVLGVAQYRSANGGQTFERDFGRGVHADGHALWIDPRDGRHMIIGTDGGTYVTYDRGTNWDHLNHTAIGQFYHVAISPQEPYCVTGGLQDNGTWFGPSLGKHGGGPVNEDWLSVGGGDGFMCRVDPEDPDLVYFTSQGGAMRRRNMKTGQGALIRPQVPQGAAPYRFNWNTPFILSSHNSRIFYCGGNYVFRSLDRGDDLQVISPEITLTKRGSATTLSESPRNANVLYVGTDDGALWVTRDGGQQWKEISKNLGLPGPRWVATIESSRFVDGRVYVALDGHRSNDDEPYLYVSEDYGATWQSLKGNLPWGSTRCLREDLENPDLLFAGTEFAAWFSIDRGKSWNKMNANLPTVAVHELAIHPNNGEIVAATHGRSLWIADISVLRQIKADNLQDQIALYQPVTAIRWQREPTRGRTNRRFVGTNPPSGAPIYYSLPAKAKQISLEILDIKGDTIREINGPVEPGMHRVMWDLAAATRQARPAGRSGPPPAGPGSRPALRAAEPGSYRVVLKVDGQEFVQTIDVQRDPDAPISELSADEEVFDELFGQEEEEEEEEEEEASQAGRWIDD